LRFKIEGNSSGVHRSGKFLQISLLAEVSPGVSPREGELPRDRVNYTGGEGHCDEAVRDEQQGIGDSEGTKRNTESILKSYRCNAILQYS